MEIGGYIGVIVLLILLLIGTPIAFSLLVGGFVGMFVYSGPRIMDAMAGILPFSQMASAELSVIPLFILVGALAAASGISGGAYDVANRWLGRLPGGLAMTTIAACAAFAGTSGSTVATAATVGKIAIPEMRKNGYSMAFATGVVAAGGLLGIMIPPSVTLVLYGIVTEQSIGKLLAAGLFPGILTALVFMSGIYLMAKFRPQWAPRGVSFTWREKFSGIYKLWGIALLFLVIMGGIYGGIFTPTEAAAAGALTALIMLIVRRRRSISKDLKEAFWETSGTAAMIFFVLLGAAVFSAYINLTGSVDKLTSMIVSLQASRYVVLVVLTLLYILLGMFLDPISIMLITVPILLKPMVQIGFDPIWFGVYVTLMIEIANISPPVGFNIFVIKGIAPDVPMAEIFKGASVFVVLELVVLVFITAIPQIALFLPSRMVGR